MMKACVLEKSNQLIYKEVKIPILKNGEVLLKIKACGICNSDFDRVFNNGAYFYPIILGHEIAGEIVEVASDVDKSFIGKRAVVFPLLPCKKCKNCLDKNYAQCEKYSYFGSRCDGGFAQYLAVPIWNIKIFNKNINFECACLCEPMAVGYHSFNKIKNDKNKKILVIGTGIIGIAIGLFAKMEGFEVFYSTKNPKKADFLKDIGLKSIITELFDEKFDICFECVGSNKSLETAINHTITKGKIIIVGNPKEDVILQKIVYWKILRQELHLEGVWNSSYPDDWDEVLLRLEQLPLNKLITHKFTFSDGINAFRTLSNNDIFKIKGVFVD